MNQRFENVFGFSVCFVVRIAIRIYYIHPGRRHLNRPANNKQDGLFMYIIPEGLTASCMSRCMTVKVYDDIYAGGALHCNNYNWFYCFALVCIYAMHHKRFCEQTVIFE